VFVVGDVHGCARELKLLLNKLPLTSKSTVVFLGDYIDRGPESRQVVETILELRSYCKVITLTGNHEEMLRDFLRDSTSHGAGLFIYNGGGATLASYGDERGKWAFPEEHRRFFDELLLCYENEQYFFVHAGVPDVPLDQLDPIAARQEMLWVRRTFHKSRFPWTKTIVHGHTPMSGVEFAERRINVDTGCVYGGQLTAVELPSRKVYSVQRDPDQGRVYLRDFASSRRAVRHRGAVSIYVHRGDQVIELETIDYSEVGMLVHHVARRPENQLKVGEQVHGYVGSDGATLVAFQGQVVRVDADADDPHYALRIDHTDMMP
jgi:serine/threonine protein phosphatase 1